MKVGIVTGASSGIGREFAEQIQNIYDLDEIWLIARSKDQLEETASTLNKAKGVLIPTNLTSAEDLDTLKEKIETESPQICVLVNSAGYGLDGLFGEVSLDRHLDIIDLNIKAMVKLTHYCLPYMSRESTIFQIGSVNAFIPLPKGAIYAATKAFVHSFTVALHQELKKKGIRVIAVSPGPVYSKFAEVASDGAVGTPSNAAQPSDVVSLAIREVDKGKVNSTYGFIPKLNRFLGRTLNEKFLLKLLSR